jgi:hypothetical protein
MTVKDIQRAIAQRFDGHKYETCNAYIYNWECDFHSTTTSKYHYEVEIKVSRADYFRDFKKWKHELFKAAFAGKKIIVTNNGPVHGDLMFIVDGKKMIIKQDYLYRGDQFKNDGIFYDRQAKIFITNQWDRFDLQEKRYRSYAPATAVRFYNMELTNIPNRFYFAVPVGLIKKQEVPPYAGLIYVDGGGAQIEKEAPFLHKRILDLKTVLLNKFYYDYRKLKAIVDYDNK